jgi:uncharacterized DUF497 family protein
VEFEWDHGNRNHIARHGVNPEDCQAAMLNPLETSPDPERTEPRFRTIGFVGGRRLEVVWTPRGNRIRVVTAWWKGTRRK